MDISLSTKQLEQFRRSLYQNFNQRAETRIELVDAISSRLTAKSAVEYSLAASFRRSYSTLFKAIDAMKLEPLW